MSAVVFPVRYPDVGVPPLGAYLAEIDAGFERLGLSDARLWAEPGRALVAGGASVVVQVQASARQFAVCQRRHLWRLADAGPLGFRYPARLLRPDGPPPPNALSASRSSARPATVPMRCAARSTACRRGRRRLDRDRSARRLWRLSAHRVQRLRPRAPRRGARRSVPGSRELKPLVKARSSRCGQLAALHPNQRPTSHAPSRRRVRPKSRGERRRSASVRSRDPGNRRWPSHRTETPRDNYGTSRRAPSRGSSSRLWCHSRLDGRGCDRDRARQDRYSPQSVRSADLSALCRARLCEFLRRKFHRGGQCREPGVCGESPVQRAALPARGGFGPPRPTRRSTVGGRRCIELQAGFTISGLASGNITTPERMAMLAGALSQTALPE